MEIIEAILVSEISIVADVKSSSGAWVILGSLVGIGPPLYIHQLMIFSADPAPENSSLFHNQRIL
jgi:hypothetical protein